MSSASLFLDLIEPPRFPYNPEQFCCACSVEYENIPYSTGALSHCVQLEKNQFLTIHYYTASNGSEAGRRCYRKKTERIDLGFIKAHPSGLETIRRTIVTTMNEFYHMSMNDFRSEGEFIRFKLNPYYIPNTYTNQFLQLTIDTKLCQEIELSKYSITIATVSKDQLIPIPYIVRPDDLTVVSSLFDFIAQHCYQQGEIFAFRDASKQLDFTKNNYTRTKNFINPQVVSEQAAFFSSLAQLSQASASSSSSQSLSQPDAEPEEPKYTKKRARISIATPLSDEEFQRRFGFSRIKGLPECVLDLGDGRFTILLPPKKSKPINGTSSNTTAEKAYVVYSTSADEAKPVQVRQALYWQAYQAMMRHVQRYYYLPATAALPVMATTVPTPTSVK